MDRIAVEDFVVVGAVGDNCVEAAAPNELEDAVFCDVGLAGCPGEDQAADPVAPLSQDFGR